ncbi:MAG: PIG-L family deacetylase [Anaerolineae bacterium]|nr:PIG-L family deacetylase [Anaerolineae bacterium]
MNSLTNHLKQQRLLVVLAHPDDEVFCAGGLLARAAAMGAETMVVSATRGEAGQIRDAKVATRRTLGQVREHELHRSCRWLGVNHTLCMDYGDGTLQDIEPMRLVEDIVHIIRQFRPDTVVTFGPDGAYGHPDHVAIGAATTRAFSMAGDGLQFPQQLRYGLTAYTPARLYYSHFPPKERLLSDRLAHWLVDLSRRFKGTAEFAHALLLLSAEATMLGYVSDHVETSWFPAGFHIVEQGEPATKLYLILSGQAEVRHEGADGIEQTLAHIGPGQFFGEEGLARRQPRNAHVVATENVTCLVFSASAPSNFAGRGTDATLTETAPMLSSEVRPASRQTISLDISDYVPQKIAAMAAHRTQFSLDPEMLPLPIMREIFGQEHFIQAFPPVLPVPDKVSNRRPVVRTKSTLFTRRQTTSSGFIPVAM